MILLYSSDISVMVDVNLFIRDTDLTDIYRPRPALRVGGFLAGPADGLTRAFFSTVVPPG
jgi:hypothetical protein